MADVRIDRLVLSHYPPADCEGRLAVAATTLRAGQADLTTLRLDAIVNAADESLVEPSCISEIPKTARSHATN
jgi:hypothetical protein